MHYPDMMNEKTQSNYRNQVSDWRTERSGSVWWSFGRLTGRSVRPNADWYFSRHCQLCQNLTKSVRYNLAGGKTASIRAAGVETGVHTSFFPHNLSTFFLHFVGFLSAHRNLHYLLTVNCEPSQVSGIDIAAKLKQEFFNILSDSAYISIRLINCPEGAAQKQFIKNNSQLDLQVIAKNFKPEFLQVLFGCLWAKN